MFQFPSFPLPALYIQAGVTPNDGCRVSPFGYPRIKAYSAAPRGLSQPITSFIGVRRQGIHHWLFVAWYIDTQSRRIKSPLSHIAVPAHGLAHGSAAEDFDARASLCSCQRAAVQKRGTALPGSRTEDEPTEAADDRHRHSDSDSTSAPTGNLRLKTVATVASASEVTP